MTTEGEEFYFAALRQTSYLSHSLIDYRKENRRRMTSSKSDTSHFANYRKAAAYLKNVLESNSFQASPVIGIICGSGLSVSQ